ncbi:hypothetical protein J3R74_002491 [Puniceicoccus vermicola]
MHRQTPVCLFFFFTGLCDVCLTEFGKSLPLPQTHPSNPATTCKTISQALGLNLPPVVLSPENDPASPS